MLFNRELSWLEFDRRVLAEAESESVPLLERVKFLAIAASNLDEFLMIRFGAVRSLIAGGIRERSPDGMTPKQQLKAIRKRVKKLLREMYGVHDELLPLLAKSGIRIEDADGLTKKQRAALSETFEARIAPVLTPLACDPGHPLPFLASGALTLAVVLSSGSRSHTAFMKVPRSLPRFLEVSAHRVLPIEELIRVHAGTFFPGLEVREVVPFRVLRNADILLRQDEVEDVLKSVETELRRRERKETVWLEVAEHASKDVVALLQREHHVGDDDVFVAPGLLRLGDLMELWTSGPHKLKDPPFSPRMPQELVSGDDLFSVIGSGDVLLHRPYESFAAVAELVACAADDPDVIAIKQTLYRTEPDSVVVDALARAAEQGKQVTAVIEVQARFDEARNIAWARRLEEAGVQIVYGLVGIKTHAKLCVVVRREGDALRRYVHLSTGNYNAKTARQYTDVDLLTCDADFGDDAAQLMNLITGYSTPDAQELFGWRALVVAPTHYHAWVLQSIEREAAHAREGRPARIIAKLNALVEPQVIEALYAAADAGVKIDLIVRGICCLVPRENIRVVSIVDRFLEHARLFLFRNGGDTEVWVASGDWMPRNFFRRIEIAWPIRSPEVRDRIEHEILATCLADDTKSWKLQEDGTYKRRKGGKVRSQQTFIELAAAASAESSAPAQWPRRMVPAQSPPLARSR